MMAMMGKLTNSDHGCRGLGMSGGATEEDKGHANAGLAAARVASAGRRGQGRSARHTADAERGLPGPATDEAKADVLAHMTFAGGHPTDQRSHGGQAGTRLVDGAQYSQEHQHQEKTPHPARYPHRGRFGVQCAIFLVSRPDFEILHATAQIDSKFFNRHATVL